MADILAFPGAARAPLPAPPDAAPPRIHSLAVWDARGNFMAVGELVQRLALDRHTARVRIEKLRLLAEHSGLPLPVNPRIVGGRPVLGPDAICAASRWDRGAVLAWLDHGGPCGAGTPPAAGPRNRDRLTRDRLANRAAALLAHGARA